MSNSNVKFKDSGDKKDFGCTWTDWLEGDTIASSSWVVESGLTQMANPAPSFTANTTTIWLEGGTDGVTYSVTNHIITAASREAEQTLLIRVRQK